jgi:hypothetical protein
MFVGSSVTRSRNVCVRILAHVRVLSCVAETLRRQTNHPTVPAKCPKSREVILNRKGPKGVICHSWSSLLAQKGTGWFEIHARTSLKKFRFLSFAKIERVVYDHTYVLIYHYHHNREQCWMIDSLILWRRGVKEGIPHPSTWPDLRIRIRHYLPSCKRGLLGFVKEDGHLLRLFRIVLCKTTGMLSKNWPVYS